jgi:hypothetical protein
VRCPSRRDAIRLSPSRVAAGKPGGTRSASRPAAWRLVTPTGRVPPLTQPLGGSYVRRPAGCFAPSRVAAMARGGRRRLVRGPVRRVRNRLHSSRHAAGQQPGPGMPSRGGHSAKPVTRRAAARGYAGSTTKPGHQPGLRRSRRGRLGTPRNESAQFSSLGSPRLAPGAAPRRHRYAPHDGSSATAAGPRHRGP